MGKIVVLLDGESLGGGVEDGGGVHLLGELVEVDRRLVGLTAFRIFGGISGFHESLIFSLVFSDGLGFEFYDVLVLVVLVLVEIDVFLVRRIWHFI